MTITPSSQDSSTNSTETGSERVGWQRVRLIVVLGAITALGPFTVDMYLSAFPSITVDFATSDAAVQFTLTGSLVGFAAGQLVIGPLSDGFGRRRPLIVGSVVHLLASLGCVVAPTIETLASLRMLQGFGAAAGAVLAMAVVRDLYDGNAAAVMMSRLMLVMGVAPILAPTIGGFVLTVSTWRSIFLVLAVLGGVVVLLGLFGMPETLPVSSRTRPRPAMIATNYGRLCTDPHFVRLVLVCGAGRVLMFSYIAASPFVLQSQFGLSPAQFGLSFASGAAILIASSQVNVVLLRWWTPRTLLRAALSIGAVVGAVFVVLAATRTGGLWGFALPVMALLAVMGSVMPNAPAVALTDQRRGAGTASALIGGFQFACAAAAAPVVGLLGNDALAVASMMGGAAAVAALLMFTDRRLSTPIGNEQK